jgi:hypothetical protein
MPSDTTLPQGVGWVFWYIGEVAFKWIPGFVVSLTTGQTADSAVPPVHPPTITEPVRIQDVVQFLQSNSEPGTYSQLYNNWFLFVGISIAVSLVFAGALIYCLTRIFQIRRAEYKRFLAVAHTVSAHDIPKTRLRWDRILEQANSESDPNRRLAILEADIMLGELLDELGYRGETLADKMRQVPKAQFNTIDLAWEAHRARNVIAHEAGHAMSDHEVRRVIGLYDKVFREFGFIEV